MLLDLFEHDREAIVELLAAAIDSIAKDVATIERSAIEDDRHSIVEAAHRIRGTSGSVGAGSLVEISARIEAAVTRTRDKLTPGVILELNAAVTIVRDDIDAYTRATGSA